MTDKLYDIFVIGGGVNGCGIARDAAGRGLSVALAEMQDLGWATSSAATKLFHGGLRYLEFFEFRLVREALSEREFLLRAMPHIAWPMRFVLPFHPEMRFDAETPASRVIGTVFPWLKGRRPAWAIRAGLFLYDHLGGRRILPGTRSLNLRTAPEGQPLQDRFRKAWEYSDCWVQDSRLVVLNARDAAARGARVMTRTRVVRAERSADAWTIHTDGAEGPQEFRARALVNAAGPWVSQVIGQTLGLNAAEKVRLVRGSHIVTRRLYDHDKCYFFQGSDGRIIFAIPYEGDFTLIGTTDLDHADPGQKPECTPAETEYLCRFASEYFARPVTPADVVWSYSGVRPLFDDGQGSATATTREYVLRLDRAGAPLLNVFGGKLTTYRKLAEAALHRLAEVFADLPGDWTRDAVLPGGDFPVDGAEALAARLAERYPFLGRDRAMRLVRTYGTDSFVILGDARSEADLGQGFACGVTEAELRWGKEHEWARSAEDFLWRRTRLGLHMSGAEAAAVEAWFARA